MAWGYEKGFSIEHLPKEKKKLSCSDCDYYDKSDKSCGKSPRYLPVDGYDSWKYCGLFLISSKTSFQNEKISQYNTWIRKKVASEKANDQEKNTANKEVISKKEVNKTSYSPKQLKTNYSNYPHETHTHVVLSKKIKKLQQHPIITKEELENLILVGCNSKKDIPNTENIKALVHRNEHGEEQFAIIYVDGRYAYYIIHHYSKSFRKKIRKSFIHVSNP